MSLANERRKAIKKIAYGAAAIPATSGIISAYPKPGSEEINKPVNMNLKGNINHSACRWCYNGIPLEPFLEQCQEMGLKSVELLGPEEWDLADKNNLTCAVATDFSFVSIENAFNQPKNHATLQEKYKGLIDGAADRGYPTVIVFSGNKRGMEDDTAIENCAVGLEPLVKQAEARNITLIMELLNSKVNHKDYQCDHTPWGVKMVDKIGSPNFKLLYDIYHMQIMEGDIIATIKDYHDYFAHYHTGGVPGRHEINDSQELNYPAIMKAIVETGYKGFVGQEFVPAGEDKMASLKEGVLICDV